MLHITQVKQEVIFPSNSFKSQAVVRTIYKKPWASQSQADHSCCPRHPTLVVDKMKKLWPLNFRRLLHCKRLTLSYLFTCLGGTVWIFWIFILCFARQTTQDQPTCTVEQSVAESRLNRFFGPRLSKFMGYSTTTKFLLFKEFLFGIVVNVCDVGTDIYAGVSLILWVFSMAA